jgi:hypothetical protein
MAARTSTYNVDRDDDSTSASSTLGGRFRRPLLGLPCSQCMAYYEADRTASPICGCTVRLSPIQAISPIVQHSSPPDAFSITASQPF